MIHAYLLAFSLMAAVPVLLHMLKKGQPKRVIFPAIRFLLERQQKSRRRSQLQNLLLLLLRMAIIVLACLALARPLLPNPGIDLGQGAQVRAVVILDLSPSMGVRQGQTTPHDEANRLLGQLLERFSPESRVQVLRGDGEPLSGAEDAPAEAGWGNVKRARQQMEGARLMAGQGSVVPALRKASRLFTEAAKEGGEAPLELLLVLSDRTRQSWLGAAAAPLELPGKVQAYWLDVGGTVAPHVAITNLTLDPPAAAPGSQVRVRVEVRARGEPPGGKTSVQLTLGLDNDPDVARPVEKKAVELTSQEPVRLVEFIRQVPNLPEGEKEGYFQYTARVQPEDALPLDNTRCVTLPVRREVLILAETPADADLLKSAMDALKRHPSEVRLLSDVAAWTPQELAACRVVWLAHLRNPPPALWKSLEVYLQGGGALVVVPGGKDARLAAYQGAEANAVLPAPYGEMEELGPKERGWRLAAWDSQEGWTSAIEGMARGGRVDFAVPEYEPLVYRRWKLGAPDAEARVVVRLDDGKPMGTPEALAVQGRVGTGRVLQLATGLDGQLYANSRGWNNFWTDSSIGLVMVDRLNQDLAGTGAQAALANWVARPGQYPEVDIPPLIPAMLPLKLRGPGLQADGADLILEAATKRLSLREAGEPGNYQVRDARKRTVRAFSLAIDPGETELEKAPVNEIEDLMGKGRVLSLEGGEGLEQLMAGEWQGDLDLLPWILGLVVLMMALESYLANRVFQSGQSEESGASGPRSAA